jgi:hypothetical protein
VKQKIFALFCLLAVVLVLVLLVISGTDQFKDKDSVSSEETSGGGFVLEDDTTVPIDIQE